MNKNTKMKILGEECEGFEWITEKIRQMPVKFTSRYLISIKTK